MLPTQTCTLSIHSKATCGYSPDAVSLPPIIREVDKLWTPYLVRAVRAPRINRMLILIVL